MATKKKKAKPARKAKKKAAKRGRPAARVKPPRVLAAPKELKELDSEWRSFIRKTVPDVPLTEVWEAPKGAPSTKTTIRQAALRKAKKAAKKAGKKKAAKKSAVKKRASARKAPARRKAGKK